MITLTVTKIYFSKSYQIFPANFIPLIDLIALMQSYF